MADQSNLTIGGIGGDPSGSHPIGDLDVNWAKTIDDASIRYTANTIMSDPGATAAEETDTYYSEELCVGTLTGGATFDIGDTGDAQITACWQYYVQSNSNNFNSGNEVIPGTPASLDGGTWTDFGTPAQNYAENQIVPAAAGDEDLMYNGVTDADANGVAAGLVTAGVAAVNGAIVKLPLDKQAKKNDTVNNPVTFGGIGKDPS